MIRTGLGLPERDDYHQAVRSLAYKWIRVIYKCWKERIPYDDGHYMSMLKKRGSNLMKLIAEHTDVYRLNGLAIALLILGLMTLLTIVVWHMPAGSLENPQYGFPSLYFRV